MPAPAKRASAMDAYKYECSWGTETIGWIKDADPSGLKHLTREKRIGELDNLLVDEEIYGIEGSIKLVLHEPDVERIRQLAPWAAATGAFTLAPTVDAYSMYANCKVLTLHPRGVTGTASDFTFPKAFPKFSLPKSAGGKNWRELPVEFALFLDQAALIAATPTKVLGYHGPAPT